MSHASQRVRKRGKGPRAEARAGIERERITNYNHKFETSQIVDYQKLGAEVSAKKIFGMREIINKGGKADEGEREERVTAIRNRMTVEAYPIGREWDRPCAQQELTNCLCGTTARLLREGQAGIRRTADRREGTCFQFAIPAPGAPASPFAFAS